MIQKIQLSQIGTLGIRGSTVLLDVDGTITADRQENIASEDMSVLLKLAADNVVYLCTNAKNPERISRLAALLGVKYAPVPANKPSIAFLKDIPLNGDVVVIGDKLMTDYIVARKIGARVVVVTRKTASTDPIHTSLGYFGDDICFYAFNLFSGLEEKYAAHMKIARFIISGGSAAFIDLVLLFLLTSILHVWYVISATIAFAAAFLVSFILQKYWTFRDDTKDRIHAQAIGYFVISALNLGLNTLLVYFFVQNLRANYLFAQICSSILIALESYFLYQIFVFKKRDLK